MKKIVTSVFCRNVIGSTHKCPCDISFSHRGKRQHFLSQQMSQKQRVQCVFFLALLSKSLICVTENKQLVKEVYDIRIFLILITSMKSI